MSATRAGAVRPHVGREVECELAGRFGPVAGMDEVGRGALAGPVAVGVAVADAACGEAPTGLADSKMLTPARREALCAPVAQWALGSAVGWASSAEVDRWGINGALRLAGRRALAQVGACGCWPGVVLLDGSFDWLAPGGCGREVQGILGDEGVPGDLRAAEDARPPCVPVVTRVRADATCAVVAAASVIAKVARDDWMRTVEDPGYGWAHNKGYATERHVQALARLGPSPLHRVSWRLPGVANLAPVRPEGPAEGMMVQ